MKRLRQPLSIKKKLLLFFVVLFCVPFLFSCLIWYAKSADTIEESGIYYNEQLIRRVNAQLDEYFAGIKADTAALPGHPLVQEFIKADPVNTYEMYRLKGRISNELVANMRKDVYGFSMISSNGGYYGDLMAGPWVKGPLVMPLMEQSFKVLGITEKNGEPVVAVYRKVIDNVTYQPAGALIMAFPLSQMLKILDMKPYGKNGSIAIADEEGRIIYHTDREKWGTELPEVWTRMMDSTSGRFEEDGPDGNKMMVYQVSRLTSFKVISATSKYELLGGLLRLQMLTLIIGALILVLAFIVFYRMFHEVKKLMEEIHVTRVREKELELKHREALMSALQSRINPHFLYNTLEVINSYAVMANVKPISQMTVHLSNIFRYSVSNPDQVVHLREELDHIISYIKVQEQRFEDLQVEINVDETLLDSVYLFRLTVQPLVENVFQHAYEKHGITPGIISIHGVAENGMFSLFIRDQGMGMPTEMMDKYNKAFDSVTEAKMLRAGFNPFQTIGLWNVHTRLRLGFGHPYGIRITESGEQGSEIQMMLPYMKGVLNNVQSADCG